MAKVGRPSKDTEDVRRKIEEAAAIDASVEEIAFYAGIHRDTLHEILKNDPVFSDRVEALRNRPVIKARQTIAKSLENPGDARWYLEKKRKKEFGPAVDITSGGDKLLPFTDEQIQRIARGVVNGSIEGKGTPDRLPDSNKPSLPTELAP